MRALPGQASARDIAGGGHRGSRGCTQCCPVQAAAGRSPTQAVCRKASRTLCRRGRGQQGGQDMGSALPTKRP